VFIIAGSIAAIQFVFAIVNTVFLSKAKCRQHCSFRINQITQSVLTLGMAALMITSIYYNKQRFDTKNPSLQDWSEFNDCVDSYMQVTKF
jgi:hypothetical protein